MESRPWGRTPFPVTSKPAGPKGPDYEGPGEWDGDRVTQQQQKIWLLDLGDSEMLIDEVTNETPDAT